MKRSGKAGRFGRSALLAAAFGGVCGNFGDFNFGTVCANDVKSEKTLKTEESAVSTNDGDLAAFPLAT
ncbi:MAG: hypothetical protein IJE77_10220, partial [Thermoguttaceae bacterium]|nr:hypothetical protein [Thermoguttaceae bacterium]